MRKFRTSGFVEAAGADPRGHPAGRTQRPQYSARYSPGLSHLSRILCARG